MFLGTLTIGCSAIVMEQNNQFDEAITSTSEKERWEKALCILNLSARQLEKKKIKVKVAKLVSELLEKLPFSYLAFISKWFVFPLSPYFYKLSGTKELPIKFKSAVKEHLDKKFNYPFIPPIVFGPPIVEKSGSYKYIIDYNHKFDLIQLDPSYMEKLLKNGLENVALNIIEINIPFIMGIRKNKKMQIAYYYRLKTKKSGKKEDTELFKKYVESLITQTIIEGCINEGLSNCRKIRDFDKEHQKYKTESINKMKQEDMCREDQLIHDMEQEDRGRCFNPLHKMNGLPRWFDCDNSNSDK